MASSNSVNATTTVASDMSTTTSSGIALEPKGDECDVRTLLHQVQTLQTQVRELTTLLSTLTTNITRPTDTLQVYRTSSTARLPRRQHDTDAGLDLYPDLDQNWYPDVPTSLVCPAGKTILVPTGVCVAIPRGFMGRIAERSGLALKAGLRVGGGIIDSDYRGPVGVIIHNTSAVDVTIDPYSAIAQLIIVPIALVQCQEVSDKYELGQTVRGSGGFGSTG